MTQIIFAPDPEYKVLDWTLERYHRAIEAGVFDEDDHLELLFGKIIEKMPIGESHVECVTALLDYFYQLFGSKYKYRTENPITLPNESEPEPDFVVVTRKKYDKQTGHPKPEDVLLLVEVADASIRRDRGPKATAYALAGIREYWIIDVNARSLTLHLHPAQEDGIYEKVLTFSEGASFESPFAGETLVDSFIEAA